MADIENENELEDFARTPSDLQEQLRKKLERQQNMTVEEKDAKIAEMIDILWEEYDDNKDGKLQKEECRRMMKEKCKGSKVELKDDTFNDLFDKLDKDNSGYLDKEELTDFFKQYCKGQGSFDEMLTNEILRRIRVNQNEPEPGDLFGYGVFKFKAACHLMTKHRKDMFSGKYKQEKTMIRKDQIGFIRKVFGIVGAMLSISLAFVILQALDMLGTPDIEEGKSWWNTGACMSVAVCLLCTFLLIFVSIPCNGNRSTRKPCHKLFPANYVLLFSFNFATTFILCFLTAKTDAYVVIQSISMTFAMVVGLGTYAWKGLESDVNKGDAKGKNSNEKVMDLTQLGPYIHMTFFLVIAMATVFLVAGDKLDSKMQMMYIFCAVMVFSLYLMFDIQTIVGGKTAMYHHDSESYALGALSIYIDIIQIGALLCQAFGSD